MWGRKLTAASRRASRPRRCRRRARHGEVGVSDDGDGRLAARNKPPQARRHRVPKPRFLGDHWQHARRQALDALVPRLVRFEVQDQRPIFEAPDARPAARIGRFPGVELELRGRARHAVGAAQLRREVLREHHLEVRDEAEDLGDALALLVGQVPQQLDERRMHGGGAVHLAVFAELDVVVAALVLDDDLAVFPRVVPEPHQVDLRAHRVPRRDGHRLGEALRVRLAAQRVAEQQRFQEVVVRL